MICGWLSIIRTLFPEIIFHRPPTVSLCVYLRFVLIETADERRSTRMEEGVID